MARFSSAAERLGRDPFRLFFPLGVVAGIVGVGQWIPWAAGAPPFMASFVHSTLQTQGFLGFFVVGFLLTALPRFTGAAYATLPEVAAAAAGAAVFLAGVLARRWEAAHAGFLFMLAVLPVFAFRRIRSGTKGRLPPSFLLLGFGLLHAAAGSILLMVTRMGMSDFALFGIGRWMVELGFLLCMVLGITAKLAPFLLGHEDVSPKDEAAVSRPDGWTGRAAIHAAAGALLFLSFIAQGPWARPAAVVRAVIVTAHLLAFARIGRFPPKRTAPALFFWCACWMISAGLGFAALFPDHKTAFVHVVFIGGFSLMIFSFGLLITLTHAARAESIKSPMTALKIVGVLVLAALALRVSADFIPARQMGLLLGASVSWVAAAALWLGDVLWKTVGKGKGV